MKRYIEDCASVDQEYLREPLQLASGHIPKALNGYLLRNGAGRFENYGIRYQHPFDGDGMICSFFFEEGKIHYSNRFVRTQEFLEEEKKGKMCYRSLGTNLPGGILQNFGKLKVKNAANTSVVYHGGKLLALWEGGLPHEIAPDNLATRGRFDYEGKLINRGSWLERYINPELAFSAHPKLHPISGDLYNFGMVSGPKNYLATHRVDP
ncbi:MAG: carotenoid oxygenase family protein, partial [Bacteroidota bacterium]